MKLRAFYPAAASLGLLAAGVGSAAGAVAPAATAAAVALAAKAAAEPAANQRLADQIAQRLRGRGLGAVADVAIVCEGGTVTLKGTARDAGVKDHVLQEARVVPGVTLVRDGLAVATRDVVQAQGTLPTAPVPPTLVGPGPGPGGPVVEPAPLGAPGMASPDQQAPPLPPYAWPTYAPYNNVSRVAYPQAYPYNAFPFIGPFYPFPKVPLGWRKVLLEWEDGHWYMGRASAPHDYWRVKFW